MNLIEKRQKLKEWFKESRFYNHSLLDFESSSYGEFCQIYMKEYKYIFSYNESSDYLGGSLSDLKPLEGENHLRGRDLSDGKFSKETFNNILLDILVWELNHR